MALPLSQSLGELTVSTRPRSFSDVTRELSSWLSGEGAGEGLLTVLLRHTSASLVIQENADPDVLRDLGDALDRLAPEGPHYRHDAEGPDDMPAHIKAALTSPTLSIPVREGRMQLGTWQGVHIAEHRSSPHSRRLSVHFFGTHL